MESKNTNSTSFTDKLKIYFLIQEWEHPASRYRVLQYVPYLKESRIESKVALFPDSFCKWMKLFSEIQDYDIIFIQKNGCGAGNSGISRESTLKLSMTSMTPLCLKAR